MHSIAIKEHIDQYHFYPSSLHKFWNKNSDIAQIYHIIITGGYYFGNIPSGYFSNTNYFTAISYKGDNWLAITFRNEKIKVASVEHVRKTSSEPKYK